MRLLVTGAAGQVGRELVEHAVALGDEVIGLERRHADLTDPVAVRAAFAAAAPDAVVHCAAWTAVDACESDPARAMRDNAVAVELVAAACERAGAHLVHLSTDYVFDGTKPTAYVETDAPNPRSVYGRSKLAGEQAVAASGASACVVRTSWVCGRYGANMARTVAGLARRPGLLRFVDDQRGHPTIVADLVPMLRRLAGERCTGTFHVTNQGEISWYGFAQAVLAALGQDPSRVEAITTAELVPPRPAPRPANSVLDSAALRSAGYELLPDFRASLRELVERLDL